MVEELKARINDFESVHELLSRLANFEEEEDIKDIYLDNESEDVKKIREHQKDNYLVVYRPKGTGFDKIREEAVSAEEKETIIKELGIEQIQDKVIRRYKWRKYDLLLISIRGTGDFLVIQGKTVDKSIYDELGVQVEEFINVAFSELN